MWPYWLMFVLPAGGAVLRPDLRTWRGNAFWFAIIGLCIFLVGFRDVVGADWEMYEYFYDQVAPLSFVDAIEFGDPGYFGLSWLVEQAGGDVHWLNAACAVAVMAGVSIFCRAQPSPWIGLAVAVPYLVIVVAMGYTRQGAAVGLALVGLAALGRDRVKTFAFWVGCAALFHKSAILLLPIAALSSVKNRAWTFVWVAVTAVVGAYLLIWDQSDELWELYVEENMQSDGGLIRVAMNASAAVVLLPGARLMKLAPPERKLWWWMAVFALCCVPLVRVSSTAVDRVAVYFIPLQIFVFSRVDQLTADEPYKPLLSASVLFFYGAVLWVWLNYASHAEAWLPYQNYLL